LGVVLGKDGGFWKRVELPLKMGFYPVVGSGKQWFSYIYVEELINIFRFIFEEKLIGVFNGTTPNPVRIGEVGKIYGEITGKKIRTINIPPSILRPFLGELVDEVLLASPQVIPKHLIEKGYTFRYPSLEDILKTLV
jgi:NAD dependent epimerase/dehydratase family enzyme